MKALLFAFPNHRMQRLLAVALGTLLAFTSARHVWGQTPPDDVNPCTNGEINASVVRTISVPAGWNLIGGSNGSCLQGAESPAYAIPSVRSDSGSGYVSYPATDPLYGGRWAYFPSGGSVELKDGDHTDVHYIVSAADSWIIAANPSPYGEAIIVQGAQEAYLYVTGTGYIRTARIPVGGSALVHVALGPTIAQLSKYGPRVNVVLASPGTASAVLPSSAMASLGPASGSAAVMQVLEAFLRDVRVRVLMV